MTELLSPGANNFLLIVIAWCLLAWFGRICKNAIMIMELSNGFHHDQVVRIDGIPMHSDFSALEVLSRGRFLHFLRSCRPAPPAIEVQTIKNPVQLNRDTLKTQPLTADGAASEGRWGVCLDFESTCPCTVTCYWGVLVESVLNTADTGELSSSSTAGGEVQKEEEEEAVHKRMFSSFSKLRRTATASRDKSATRAIGPADQLQRVEGDTQVGQELKQLGNFFEPSSFAFRSSEQHFSMGANQLVANDSTAFPSAVEVALQWESSSEKFPLVMVFTNFQQDGSSSDDIPTSVMACVHFDDSNSNATSPLASLCKQVCVTPSTQYIQQEIYGLDDPEGPDCVVCLSEPKDTILLPCRHLSVCHSCFPHLDKCPVCRAGFVSYLRFKDPDSPPEQIGEEQA